MIIMNNTRLPIARMLTFGILPGCIKKIFYRLQGNNIGKHVKLGIGSVIISDHKFSVGDYTKIGFFTSIIGHDIAIGRHTNIRSLVFIKAYSIFVGNDVTISETAMIRAGHLSDASKIMIDDLVHIFPHTTIDPSREIHLHEECAVGPGCSIFTHSSYKNILDGFKVGYGNVNIGKRVELTYNVFVTYGVNIGDDAVIAYGSYVNRDIPAEVLAAGCPAIVKRKKEEFAPIPSEKEKVVIINHILEEFDKHLELKGILHDGSSIIYDGGKNITIEGNCHFDLANYRCDHPKSELAKEMRSFLSRYGIRFITK